MLLISWRKVTKKLFGILQWKFATTDVEIFLDNEQSKMKNQAEYERFMLSSLGIFKLLKILDFENEFWFQIIDSHKLISSSNQLVAITYASHSL